jgi:hypothetical protein
VPEYDFAIQAQIPAALSALHNFICLHDPAEGVVEDNEGYDEDGFSDGACSGEAFVNPHVDEDARVKAC